MTYVDSLRDLPSQTGNLPNNPFASGMIVVMFPFQRDPWSTTACLGMQQHRYQWYSIRSCRMHTIIAYIPLEPAVESIKLEKHALNDSH
jgi:hypothetical protein